MSSTKQEGQKDWYVVHTYSGYEHRVKQNLEQRRESMGMTNYIFKVIVPENEKVKTGPNGEAKKVVENDFPGYVLVQMVMTDESWFVVRNTPGVTGFLGSHGHGSKPNPVTKEEIDRIMHRMGLIKRDTNNLNVKIGEVVSIIGGAMNGMEGKITSIDKEKKVVSVLVDMFGRKTETEISFNDIDKVY